MSVSDFPLFDSRQHIGGIRHLRVMAARLKTGEIAQLNSQTSKSVAEIWFMPDRGNAFQAPMLEKAGVTPAALLEYCENSGVQQRVVEKFFTGLSPADAEWHFTTKAHGEATTIIAIVGHPTAMKIVRDHGLIA